MAGQPGPALVCSTARSRVPKLCTAGSLTPMRRRLLVIGVGAVALSAAGSVASAGTHPGPVTVHVQPKPKVRENVRVSFSPTSELPQGGYYYAVVVLKPYRRYTEKEPPPCATSSNMERTDYGQPHPGSPVKLVLTPARSAAGHWCPGGHYSGAIYAVPHAPPCNATYPCRSEPYEPPSPCFKFADGQTACGIVASPRLYAYPAGLPQPLAPGTRIVGHFMVIF
jgi:hypothetical protein